MDNLNALKKPPRRGKGLNPISSLSSPRHDIAHFQVISYVSYTNNKNNNSSDRLPPKSKYFITSETKSGLSRDKGITEGKYEAKR